jgi:hypothetical protein
LHVAGHRVAVGGWPYPCSGFPEPAPVRSSFRRSRSPSLRRLLYEGHPDCSLPSSPPGRSLIGSWVPLLEFLKDRPSISITARVHSRLPEVRDCHSRTCSALVVPPDLGGFLRAQLCGFVAPRSRPWGSPGFTPSAGDCRRPTLLRAPSPLRSSSAGQPRACHQAPCLLAVAVAPNRSPARWNRSPTLGLEALLRPGVPQLQSFRTAGDIAAASTVLPRLCFELPWGSLDPGSHRSAVPLPGSSVATDPCGSPAPDTLLGAPRPQPKLRTRWPP